jgi:hypothetical protein
MAMSLAPFVTIKAVPKTDPKTVTIAMPAITIDPAIFSFMPAIFSFVESLVAPVEVVSCCKVLMGRREAGQR